MKVDNIIENVLINIITWILICFLSVIMFFFRRNFFYFFKKIYDQIYGKIIIQLFNKAKFKLVKNGDAIFLIDREGKKKHIPEPETFKLLGEILGFNTSEYHEISRDTAKAIKDGKEIPSLIKVDTIFAEKLNRKDAKELLKFIYRNFLDRDPDPTGEKAYTLILEKNGFLGLVKVVHEIKNSPEYLQMNNRRSYEK